MITSAGSFPHIYTHFTRGFNVYDLRNLSQPEQRRESSLKYKIRCVRCYPNGTAATPKQIRERMQEDGLTNDEVKSHLQKYPLHTIRVPASTTSPANQSVVSRSGLWMSQDQYGDSSRGSSSQFGSPLGPLQLATNTGGEDDEDAKSESYSLESHIHKPVKNDV